MSSSKLYLYFHTHWDREWYYPFETFRTSLVSLVRNVIDEIESGNLPSFYLDGQSIIFEDVIAIDPSLAPRLKKLMKSGKLAAGPWYVLADQMLVSGESLIRNLQIGLSVTEQFGTPSLIGYCPDTFGHSQDLPRILSGFGFKSAMLWRGVPRLKSGPIFNWQSLDGSNVITYHLGRGYYQSALHESISASELMNQLKSWVSPAHESKEKVSTLCEQINGALFPAGCDHLGPPANISKKLKNLTKELKNSDSKKSFDLAPISLPEFLDKVESVIDNGHGHKHALQTIRGELRDNQAAKFHANGYLLPGVLSTRLYLKEENRSSEHRLIRIIEPLNTLLRIENSIPYPQAELEHVWKLLLKNHPHDSICGCSVDAVHDQMQTRTGQLNQVLNALDHRSKIQIGGVHNNISPLDSAYTPNKLVVFNLSAQKMSGLVKVNWTCEAGSNLESNSDMQILSKIEREELFAGLELVPYYKQVDLYEGFIWADDIPALGFKEIAWPIQENKSTEPIAQISHSALTKVKIENGLLSVEANNTGEIQVAVLSGENKGKIYDLKHALRDVGDGGDTYNFDPIPNDVPIIASCISVEPKQKGPLITSLLLHYEVSIPELLEEKHHQDSPIPNLERSTKSTHHNIVTEIILKRGLSIVHFETTWDNKSSDHRLEVLLNTGEAIKESFSENHFSLVKRVHKNNASHLPVQPATEAIPDRFPCQRFFIANNQVFLNKGLPEYGVDEQNATITLLRAVSLLSRGRIQTRGGGAGPHLPTPGANCFGHNRVIYGWAPLEEDKSVEQAYHLAEQFEGNLWASLLHQDKALRNKSLFEINCPNAKIFSLYTIDNFVYLRLLNTSNKTQNVAIKINFPCNKIHKCRLDNKSQEKLSSKSAKDHVKVKMHEWELVTLRFLLSEATK